MKKKNEKEKKIKTKEKNYLDEEVMELEPNKEWIFNKIDSMTNIEEVKRLAKLLIDMYDAEVIEVKESKVFKFDKNTNNKYKKN